MARNNIIDKFLGGRSITWGVNVLTSAMLARGQNEIRRVPQPNIKRAFYRRTLSNIFRSIIGKLAGRYWQQFSNSTPIIYRLCYFPYTTQNENHQKQNRFQNSTQKQQRCDLILQKLKY